MQPAKSFWRRAALAGGLAAAASSAALLMYAAGLTARAGIIEAQLAEQRDLVRFLSSPDTATVTLAGTEQAPQARLKLVYERRTGRALLFGYDLPAAPAGKAYQIWFIVGGQAFPGRVFDPGPTGTGWWSDRIPAEGREASVFSVTQEPADGVSSPSGPMVLKSVSLS